MQDNLKIGEMPPGLSQPRPDYLARDAVAELTDLEDVRLLHAAYKPGYNTMSPSYSDHKFVTSDHKCLSQEVTQNLSQVTTSVTSTSEHVTSELRGRGRRRSFRCCRRCRC